MLSRLQRLNHLLLGGSAIAALSLLIGWLRPSADGSAASGLTEGPARVAVNNPRSIHAIPLSDLTRRNPFKPLVAVPPPPKIAMPVPTVPSVPKIPLSQRAAHLRLAGVMDGTPPQAIIEDTLAQKTLYVSAGQAIGEVQVQAVANDHVTLRYEEEELKLTMQ